MLAAAYSDRFKVKIFNQGKLSDLYESQNIFCLQLTIGVIFKGALYNCNVRFGLGSI